MTTARFSTLRTQPIRRQLRAAGITTGCAPDRFCTDEFVTRAQMAAFLERALADNWPHF
jgi:hypothetical protein